jgi:hypothetical protein
LRQLPSKVPSLIRFASQRQFPGRSDSGSSSMPVRAWRLLVSGPPHGRSRASPFQRIAVPAHRRSSASMRPRHSHVPVHHMRPRHSHVPVHHMRPRHSHVPVHHMRPRHSHVPVHHMRPRHSHVPVHHMRSAAFARPCAATARRALSFTPCRERSSSSHDLRSSRRPSDCRRRQHPVCGTSFANRRRIPRGSVRHHGRYRAS